MLPIGPVWSAFHIAMKFPGATLLAAASVAGANAYIDYQPDIADFEHTIPTNGPMIALTFDDGWRSVHDVALPMMAAHGMVGTNYITSDFVNMWDDELGYISEHHLAAFVDAGWEIGAHSIKHEDLTTLDPKSIEANMIEPYEKLVEWTGKNITSMSTPFGIYNDTVIRFAEITYDNHVNAFSPARGINTLDNFDLFSINRLDTQVASVDEICSTVKTLGENDFYVVIFHKIDNTGTDYSLTPEHFGDIIGCVKESDASVVTVSNGAESMLRRLGQ